MTISPFNFSVLKDEESRLHIFNESGSKIPVQKSDFSTVIAQIEHQENCRFLLIELVYVNETEIIRINQKHLQKDYVTDIITFRYDEDKLNKDIEGTLFCCAPRIREQADELDEPIKKEFMRIFIHGILHLIGYNDSTPTEKKTMTELENKYLAYAMQ